MRQKRAKQYRKQMLVYKHTFKFREPYQVIVDEQIVQVCEQSSYDLKKGLERTIQAEVRPSEYEYSEFLNNILIFHQSDYTMLYGGTL